MAKYKTINDGVKDTETGACIPCASGNRHWREYLAWVAEGNTPDPEFTAEELAAKIVQGEIEVLEAGLKGIDKVLLKLMIRLFQALAANGAVTKADIGDEYVDAAMALKIKLDELETKL